MHKYSHAHTPTNIYILDLYGGDCSTDHFQWYPMMTSIEGSEVTFLELLKDFVHPLYENRSAS